MPLFGCSTLALEKELWIWKKPIKHEKLLHDLLNFALKAFFIHWGKQCYNKTWGSKEKEVCFVELAHSLGKMMENSFTLQRFQRYPGIYQYPPPTTGVLKSTSTLKYLSVLQKTFCRLCTPQRIKKDNFNFSHIWC